jgi:hypothetical protein
MSMVWGCTTIHTSTANMQIFLMLTGHEFCQSKGVPDKEPTHGFFWAYRWLKTQVAGGWEKL